MKFHLFTLLFLLLITKTTSRRVKPVKNEVIGCGKAKIISLYYDIEYENHPMIQILENYKDFSHGQSAVRDNVSPDRKYILRWRHVELNVALQQTLQVTASSGKLIVSLVDIKTFFINPKTVYFILSTLNLESLKIESILSITGLEMKKYNISFDSIVKATKEFRFYSLLSNLIEKPQNIAYHMRSN